MGDNDGQFDNEEDHDLRHPSALPGGNDDRLDEGSGEKREEEVVPLGAVLSI